MAHDISLSMDGLLLNWLKQAGDTVKKGEIIAEFEADKATVEVEATADGVLSELLADIGDEVKEGTVIARIGEGGASAAPAPKAEAAAPAQAATPKADAAPAQADAAPAQAESAPATNGIGGHTEDGRIKASPLAKKIASDKGVDLGQVTGTGPGGRIVKADVEGFTPAQAAAPAAKAAPTAAPVEHGAFPQSYGKLPEHDVEIIDMNRMRKAIAKSTINTWQSTPHFFVTMEIAMEAVLKLRSQLNKDLEADGVKITVNDMLIKAVALALKKFPNLNTHYYGDKLVRHKRINVSIAVSLPENGLVNVVSPDADKASLSTMAQYHKHLFDEVRNGHIKAEYIQGGTFLVSNLGAYGVDEFSSIIEAPQAAALAVGASKQIPVVLPDGTLAVGTRMRVTLSIDHRVSDGAEGAQFLAYLKELIESPMRLLV